MVVILVIVAVVILLFIISNLNKEIDTRASNAVSNPVRSNEITIKTTQMTYPHTNEIIDVDFTFIANYKGSPDLARIFSEDDIDLYKRITSVKSRFGVNARGKQIREDSYIMDGDRYDVTFIQDSDVKISILTLENNLVTFYK